MSKPSPSFLTRFLTPALSALLLLAIANPAAGQSARVLYNFLGSENTNLGMPLGALVADKDGNLYGATEVPDFGAIFKLSRPTAGSGSWTATLLYKFQCRADGCIPNGNMVIDKNGNLYGTTSGIGGQGDCEWTWCGSVFELSPPTTAGGTWTLTNLESFIGTTNGVAPNAGLLMDASGNLYGTTSSSGALGAGTFFKLTPPSTVGESWTQSTLFNFPGFNYPAGTLAVDKAGNFYGVSEYSGSLTCELEYSAIGCGTVFQLVPPSGSGQDWTENILYSFTGAADGAFPRSGLALDEHGNLFGTTVSGGGADQNCNGKGFSTPGCGVVFELSPPTTTGAWTQSVLYTFGITNTEQYPWTTLLRDQAGDLFGTVFDSTSFGEIFKLSPPTSGSTAWTNTTLAAFPGTSPNGGWAPMQLTYVKGVGLISTALIGSGMGEVIAVNP